jgi:hypothetical protein
MSGVIGISLFVPMYVGRVVVEFRCRLVSALFPSLVVGHMGGCWSLAFSPVALVSSSVCIVMSSVMLCPLVFSQLHGAMWGGGWLCEVADLHFQLGDHRLCRG